MIIVFGHYGTLRFPGDRDHDHDRVSQMLFTVHLQLEFGQWQAWSLIALSVMSFGKTVSLAKL